MITRRQVAARLGKSVATVRRIEGVLLFPVRDQRGVLRFDPDDVERLAKRVAEGTVSLWRELRSSRDRTGFQDRLGGEQRAGASGDQRRAEHAVLKRQNEELRQALRELGSFVLDVCTRAQLGRLAPGLVVALQAQACGR